MLKKRSFRGFLADWPIHSGNFVITTGEPLPRL